MLKHAMRLHCVSKKCHYFNRNFYTLEPILIILVHYTLKLLASKRM